MAAGPRWPEPSERIPCSVSSAAPQAPLGESNYLLMLSTRQHPGIQSIARVRARCWPAAQPSMPNVVTTMMLAVSASPAAYCCAKDRVLVGIVLATKSASAIAPDTPATLIMMKNRAGWTSKEMSEPIITVGDVSLMRCAASTRPLAKMATPAAETAKGFRAVDT
jgi:hypothetical protein